MRSCLILALLIGCASEEKVTSYNSNPEATIVSHSATETFLEGYDITFQATVSDANHTNGELLVKWSTDQREVCPPQAPEIDGTTICTIRLEEGETQIIAQVTDPEGASGIAQIDFTVTPSLAPEVTINSPTTDERYYTDNQILFSANITDEEDPSSSLMYEWESSIDGILSSTVSANSDGLIEEYFTLSEGEHAITITVEDLSGKTTTQNASIYVNGQNTVPSCEITDPTGGETFISGENINFIGNATDSEIDFTELDIMWRSDQDGDLGPGLIDSTGQVTFSTDALSSTTHNIQFEVKDELEAVCTDTVTISVGTPPILTMTSPLDDDVVQVGDSISFQGTLTDNEEASSSIFLSWNSDIDGEFSTQSANSNGNITLNTSALSVGLHNISIMATDSIGLTDSHSLSIRVNTAPTPPTVTLTPDPANTTDNILAIASGSTDADGQNVTYQYEWFINGQTTGLNSANLNPSNTQKGDLCTVRVTPNDGYSDGNFTESSLIISNASPVINTHSISPSIPNSLDTVACNVGITEEDGDILTEVYTWTNDTTGFILGTSQSLALNPSMVSPGDSISCSYEVDDGSESDSSNTSVMISNTGPIVNSVTVIPSVAVIGDTISCVLDVSDPDQQGYTESYLWTNDTTGATIGSSQNLTLSESIASPNDVITCSGSALDPQGGSGSDSGSITLGNQDPSIDSITFSNETPVVGDTVECIADATDPDGDSLSMTFEWSDENGSVLASTAELFLDATIMGSDDELTCTVTVDDGFGGTITDNNQLILSNTTPEITDLVISNDEPVTTETITCTVTASDADGDSLTEEYTWVNETQSITLGTGSSFTLSPLFTQPGDILRCDATVADNSETSSDSVYAIVQNSTPAITDVEIAPNPLYINSTVGCSATVDEPDLESTTDTYQWVNIDQNTIIANTQSFVLTSALASPQESIECTVSATDPSGESGSYSTSLVVDNQAPEITSLSLDASTVALNETITCSATASDPEGDVVNISYEWANDTTGQVIATSAALTLDATMGTGGDNLSCTVTATDSYSASGTERVTITVEGSEPVFDTEAYITPSTGVDTGTTLTCSGLALDPDGGAVTLGYTWTNDTQGTTLGANTSLTLSPTITAPNDVVRCVITATDTSGDEVTSSSSVGVINQAPTLSNIVISPSSSVQTDTSLSCSVDLTDPDEEGLSVTYTWINDTQSTTIGSSSSITLNASLVQPSDVVRCRASVSDNYGASDFEFTTVTVENYDPVIASAGISPDPAYNTDSLTCSVVATDADAQPLSESYVWTNTTTGASLGTGSTVSINSSVASRGDVITCDLSVTDSSSASASSSATITLGNRAPDTPIVTLSPDPAYVDSTLTCAPNSSDPDGDSVSYSYGWSIDGTPTSDTTSTLSAAFAAGETVECTVTPNDGILDGSTGSSSVTITNTVPSLDSITLSPNPVSTTQDLTATVTSSDLDGDTLSFTYDWYVDSSLIQSDVINTFSSSNFNKDQTVMLEVTASDGNDTDSSTATIVVSNTVPQAPSISLSPAAPVEGIDALVCSVDTDSVDVDSDDVTYSFAWTVDSVSYTSATNTTTTSTVSASETIAAEVWECTVTPNDGDDDGAATSTSTTIDSAWDGPITFTNCDQTGRTGPSQSQCNGHYAGSILDGEVSVVDGIQYWTVPATGTFRIEVSGAAGGVGLRDHGSGAYMSGDFDLIEDQVLAIIVGQKGGDHASQGGGGGGGSFVWLESDTEYPLIAAGGGGGGSDNQSPSVIGIHIDGQTTETLTYNSVPGSGGDRGMTSSWYGGGGGGWNGNGTGGGGYGNPGYSPLDSTYPAYGGQQYSSSYPQPGGFGGGGGSGYDAGGGGGGYTGGQGGAYSSSMPHASGGGSYNSGLNQSNLTGNNSDHGYVVIDKP